MAAGSIRTWITGFLPYGSVPAMCSYNNTHCNTNIVRFYRSANVHNANAWDQPLNITVHYVVMCRMLAIHIFAKLGFPSAKFRQSTLLSNKLCIVYSYVILLDALGRSVERVSGHAKWGYQLRWFLVRLLDQDLYDTEYSQTLRNEIVA